jgi:hypothetical protein
MHHSCKRNEYVINVLREYFIVFPRRVLYNWNNLHYKPIFLKGDQQNLNLLTQPKKKKKGKSKKLFANTLVSSE